jgi:hypothetical protein
MKRVGASAWVLLCLAACGASPPNTSAAEAPVAGAAAPAAERNAAAVGAPTGAIIVLVGCRQGGCLWERRLSERRLPTAGGTLIEFVSDTGRSVHPDGEVPEAHEAGIAIEWSGRRTTYVRCSATAPMLAFSGEGDGLIVHHLDLFATAGYNYSSAQTYMRTCHDRDYVEDEQVLRALGYRPGTRNEQVEAAGVEAIDG